MSLHLPVDLLLGSDISEASSHGVRNASEGIPAGYSAFDQGPKTNELFSSVIKQSKTIVWSAHYLAVVASPIKVDT